MPNKIQELKEINAQKKALAKKQRELREFLNATKEQRKEQRKVRAETRKGIRILKSALLEVTPKVLPAVKDGEIGMLELLADQITDTASQLSAEIRKFAEASKEPELEGSEELDDL